MLQRMRQLPRGTVTMLFTDIEGSTRLLQELGRDAYVRALTDHRRLLREAFTRHGGVEVEMQGDSFFFAFARAGDAVRAAAEGQRALAGHPWPSEPIRVRIGIHTGEPIVNEGLYAGLDVHRAARVMSAAHGGQVLISEATRKLVDEGADVRDLGSHRLKDLLAPQRLYQFGEGEHPALRTLHRTNLPVQPTPLVGRERELAEAADLLETHRLLTLVGPGGIGKTRLALQIAAEAVERFDGGVWWVSLAAVTDPDRVESTIAETIGARDGLAAHLGGHRTLLLLDNFEYLLAAAPRVADLLATVPDVTALVTSRASLHVAGEQEYPVAPLSEADAVTLFTERARAVDPGFEPDADVPVICRRLDGLPLAVELAAARVRALPPARIVDRLARALPLLTGGARDAPDRQRTLRATIEWSYGLLDEAEQRILDALSLFAGSFSLEAAEEVCGAELDTIDGLLDKSLLRRTEQGRYFLLETVREFAGERIAHSGERDEANRRHVDYLVRLASQAESGRGVTADPWQRFVGEQENFRAALAWAQGAGDTGAQLDLIGSSWPFWWYRGNAAEGRRWVETALEGRGGETSPRTVRVLAAGAMFAHREGDVSALGRFSGESLQAARRLGDRSTMVWPLILRALSKSRVGDYDGSARLYEEAIALAEAVGDKQLVGIANNNLGSDAMEQKDYPRAIRLLEAALAISRELMTPDEIAIETMNLALCLYRTGRTAEAVESAKEGLTLAREGDSRTTLCYGFTLLGALAFHQDRDPVAAATLMGVAERLSENIGEDISDDPELVELVEPAQSGLPRMLGTRGFAEAVEIGRSMRLDDAVDYALESIK